MKMKPIGDLVLLELEEVKEKTESGIILMDNKTGYINAKVASIGPGLFTATGDRIPMTVQPGGQVLLHSRLLKGDNEVKLDGEKYENHEGKNVVLDDKTYLLVRESEIALVSV